MGEMAAVVPVRSLLNAGRRTPLASQMGTPLRPQIEARSEEELVAETRFKSMKSDVGDLIAEFEQHRLAYVSAARRIVGDDRAEDAVQQAFLLAFARIHTYSGDAKLRRWLLAIVRNVCLDFWRTGRRVVQIASAPAERLLVASGISAEQALIRAQASTELDAAIRRLTREQGRAIRDYLATGEVENSKSTQRVHKSRAVVALRKLLVRS